MKYKAIVIPDNESQLWSLAEILTEILCDKRIKTKIREEYIQRVLKFFPEGTVKYYR